MPGPGSRPPRGVKPKLENPKETFKRILTYVFKDYKKHYIAVICMIIISVVCTLRGTMFMQTLIDDYITPFLTTDNPDFSSLARTIFIVAGFYAVAIIASYTQSRIMVEVTQGVLRNIRNDIFEHMEKYA